MSIQSKELARDRRIRSKILTVLYFARQAFSGAGMNGRTVRKNLDVNRDFKTKSDVHCLGLIRDLVSGGYAQEKDIRASRADENTLDGFEYQITLKGVSLWNQEIPKDPSIDEGSEE